MIRVDGRAIAAEILSEVAGRVANLSAPPALTAFTCDPDFATQSYLALKARKAKEVGVNLRVVEFDREATVPEMVAAITLAHSTSDGIILQLPFPSRIPIEEVLIAVRPSHDVDGMTYDGVGTKRLPPVAGAIHEISLRHQVVWSGARVVVIGRGRLVGLPAALYAEAMGALVTVVDKQTLDIKSQLLEADIIVSGAGSPHLVTDDMVQPGVIIFDAGTSEADGVLVGDIHPSVSEKAALFTPVPGGIGPITVAVLLRNVITPL